MKFMMLMIPAVYQGGKKVDPGFVPDPEKVAKISRFNDEMAKAVKILSLNGLHPVTTGARVSFAKGTPTVTDGPFIETREQIAGYFLIQARDLREAVGIASKVPGARIGTVEVRPLIEITGLPNE